MPRLWDTTCKSCKPFATRVAGNRARNTDVNTFHANEAIWLHWGFFSRAKFTNLGDSRSFGMCKGDTSVRCRMNVNPVAEFPWIRGVLSNVLAEFGPPLKTHIHDPADAFGWVARSQMVHLRARHT